jgi:hypothetical protein
MKTLHITAIETCPKVDIKSVICKGCNLIHSLDGDGHCEFCRRRLAHPAKTTWELIKNLIFKDRETRPLPPSVITD